MNSKLTLRMDESLIASAKNYAAANGSSVSQMVANYFAAVAQPPTATGARGAPKTRASRAKSAPALGPMTRSLVGILKPSAGHPSITEDDYHAYLERKHLGQGQGRSS